MAYPQPQLYCGRCGAPLAPGATFCGRCGTPVAAQAVAAPPLYRYPPAQYVTRAQYRLAPALIAGGLITVLVLVAVVAGAFAVSRFVSGGHPTCTSDCSPKLITPLAEEASYRSSAYRFQLNYPSAWTVRSQDASGITLGTKLGFVAVAGSSGTDTAAALQSIVSGLPSAQYQDVAPLGSLKGPHIGNQDGVGALYAANLVGPSQTATKVRFAVIVASQRGVTVAVFALNQADPKGAPNGMPEGQAFDYLCTELVWG